MYYKDRLVGQVKVEVGGWSTAYDFRVDVATIDILPLVEKLPFDDLVRNSITDFLALPLPTHSSLSS